MALSPFERDYYNKRLADLEEQIAALLKRLAKLEDKVTNDGK